MAENDQSPRITICGGFAKVCGQTLRPEVQKKGEEMLRHIGNVREHQRQNQNIIVGECIREMSITKQPYNVELTLNSDREVVDSRCSCVSGVSGICKHASALVLYVNSERSAGCTDESAKWKKPSEKIKHLYPKGT